MELRTLRYFLEVAKEENMSKAAKQLHLSQSTLSKQLKRMEEELGKRLFIRHSFSMELTEGGRLLKKRAQDLISMADKITEEFSSLDDGIGGNIYFGCAESYQVRYLARFIKGFKSRYPDFHYHITSGDTEQVTEKLDQGLFDFAVIVEEPDFDKYNVLKMPEADRWGVAMRRDSPLAAKEAITFEDLRGLPLFCSEQGWRRDLPGWCGGRMQELTLEGSFRLAYNGVVFAAEGLGYLLTFEYLVNTGPDSGLVFRPLYPPLKSNMYVIWKKGQIFTPIAGRFIEELREKLDEYRLSGNENNKCNN